MMNRYGENASVKTLGTLIVWGSILTGLALMSSRNFLLFHSLAELFSIVIAWAIFLIVWNSRSLIESGYFLIIGVAYLAVGGIDLLHTLTYKGMGVFPAYDSNLPTQLWIAARYLESLSLLVAPFFVRRKIKLQTVIPAYSLMVFLLLFLIFSERFPTCYIEGLGLTPVKIISEYVIIAILGASLVLLRPRRQEFDVMVFRYVIVSIAFTIFEELAFTFYVSVYGLSNIVGHFFKVFSFYFIYKALIVTSLTRPLQTLFGALTQREAALRRSEEELRQNEARYTRAQTIGHVGNWEYDLTTAHFWGSEEAKRLYGFGPLATDFSTEEVENCIPERERVHQALIDLIEKDIPYDLEFEIHPKGAREPIMISSKAELLRDEQGNPRKVLGVIQDITARKQAEAALKTYSQHLEDIVEARARELRDMQQQLVRREKLAALGKMSGGVGHELRTPLAIISNAIYYLNMVLSSADETTQEYLDMIANEVRNAEKIVTDLLDFARIKTLTKEQVDALSAIELAVEHTNIPETIRLEYDIADGLPACVADRQHIEQVLVNLMSNACDAMPDGGTLTLRARAQDTRLSISVSDTGCGMSEEQMSRLFEPLFTTKIKGIGLGLAICKNLAEANDGKIEVESVTGKGSTFTLTLPAFFDKE